MRLQSTSFFQTASATGAPTGLHIDGLAAGSDSKGPVSASFTSAGFFLGRARSACVAFSTADAAADGTLTLEASIDAALRDSDVADEGVATWVPLAWSDSTGAVVTSATIAGATNVLIEFGEVTFRWIRCVFTRTSGTATFKARCQFKGVA